MSRQGLRCLAVLILIGSLFAMPLVAADMSGAEAKLAAQAQAFSAAWAKDDAKGLAALFTEKGTLINPFGRLAAGRAAIETLFHDEHTTFKAGTRFDVKIARVDWVTPDVAVVLWDVIVRGVAGPDGKKSDLPHQVTVVDHRVGGEWLAEAARPVAYLPAPTPPPGKM